MKFFKLLLKSRDIFEDFAFQFLSIVIFSIPLYEKKYILRKYVLIIKREYEIFIQIFVLLFLSK